jgi:hypothetical protein
MYVCLEWGNTSTAFAGLPPIIPFLAFKILKIKKTIKGRRVVVFKPSHTINNPKQHTPATSDSALLPPSILLVPTGRPADTPFDYALNRAVGARAMKYVPVGRPWVLSELPNTNRGGKRPI